MPAIKATTLYTRNTGRGSAMNSMVLERSTNRCFQMDALVSCVAFIMSYLDWRIERLLLRYFTPCRRFNVVVRLNDDNR